MKRVSTLRSALHIFFLGLLLAVPRTAAAQGCEEPLQALQDKYNDEKKNEDLAKEAEKAKKFELSEQLKQKAREDMRQRLMILCPIVQPTCTGIGFNLTRLCS